MRRGKEFKQTLDLNILLNCTLSQIKTTNSTSLDIKQPAELPSTMTKFNNNRLTLIGEILIIIVTQFYCKMVN